MNEDVDFLEKKVRGVIKPMVEEVLKFSPDNPVKFMIDWLNKFLGNNQFESGEKAELENLRKEVSKYKKIYEVNDKEMKVNSDEDEQEMNDEEKKKYDEEIENKKLQKSQNFKCPRFSVSAEVYGKYNIKKEYIPKIITKTEKQREIIKNKIIENFMFKNLDNKELNTVIDAFEERKVSSGEIIIKQGDKGDVLYLIESGKLECFKTTNGKQNLIKTYLPGESFGELALLYNAPRAATIKAKSDSVLWALDRECFNSIVKTSAITKREKYEKFLKSVELFKNFEPYEIMQICDALSLEKVNKGKNIIVEKEEGNKFYIIEEGEAYATKTVNGKEEKIMDYKVGQYFGERALLKNEPRAVNVIAKSDCNLLTLDRMAFKRLLGPLENILKRNSETYIKFYQKV